MGRCTFSAKRLRHWRMQFETPACTISCLYQDTIQDSRLMNPFPCQIANPLLPLVSFSAPSQRYSTVEEEEVCRLWPEKNRLLSRERKRRCCSCSKKEIIRLKHDSKLALNPRVKKGVHRVESYTIPYVVSRCQCWCLGKIQHSVPELMYRMSVELDSSLDPARMI
jgi:hypothetical protein